ncbi:MAG TPA: hypothetical protein VFW38_07265 [Solirubrobacteraceae bacterium]|nr:hypothetical protein [Solirubrobacteraceae bacterium]
MHSYAHQPGLLLAATVTVVLTFSLLQLPWLRGPLTSLLAAILSFCAACTFTAFVVTATDDSSSNSGDDIGRVLNIARRTKSVVGELALLLLVMTITVAILSGLLEFVFVIIALTVIFNAKSPNLLFDLPATAAVTALPVLVLFTAWSVALPVVVHERPGGILPLGRSYELIRGNRLRTFAVVALLVLLVVAVNLALRALLGQSQFEGSRLSATIASLLIAPIPLLAMNALYRELERASCASSQRLRSSPPP